MTQPQNTPKLDNALKTTRELELKDDVRLAVQVLLLMRGALNLHEKKDNPYPRLVKYIRASNAETLGGLADEVIQAISPTNFITRRALGELAEAIYCPDTELEQAALRRLQEETTPLVILMKKIYLDVWASDEAADTNEGEISNDRN